ncbi:hypothetical protein [Sphingobium xenophagum]
MISQANAINLRIQIGNANAMLANARAFVVEDAATGAAFGQAMQRIEALLDARSLDEERRSALQAIDSLENGLALARPNAHAKALGLDWF